MKMSQTLNKLKQIASKFNHNKRKHKPGESTSSRPGWMVRDSHLTIGGLRMTNTTAGTFTGLILSFMIGIGFAIPTHAADSITVSISGNPTVTVAPTSEGTFADSGNITIGVTSTAASGYTLAITGSGNTSLVGTSDNTKSITSISSAIDQNTFNTNTSYNNKWGYKPSMHYNTSTEQRASNSNYLPSPTSNADIIDITNDNSSNNYQLSIGARVTSDLGFQTYENNTFVITAVGNSSVLDCDPTKLCVEYEGNGLTYDGETLNRVNYNSTTTQKQITKTLHSDNVGDDGIATGNSAVNTNQTKETTIDGASSVNVSLYYDTEGVDYDWVALYAGADSVPSSANDGTIGSNGNLTGKLGGNKSGYTTSYTTWNLWNNSGNAINSDTIKIHFKTDNYAGSYISYGYYAIITGTSTVYNRSVSSGGYATPTGTNAIFYGWSATQTTPGGGLSSQVEYTDESDVMANIPGNEGETKTLYAVWQQGQTITFTKDSNVTKIDVLDSSGTSVGTITSSGQSLVLAQGDTYTIKPTHKSGYNTNTITKTSGAGTLSGKEFTVGAGAATLNITSSVCPSMQDLTSSTIATLLPSTGSTATVCDVRDGQAYTIAKLADNKYWMVENLNLAGGTALSSADTNVTDAYINSFTTSNRLTKNGNTIVLPASSTGFNADNFSYVYNSGNKTNCGASGQNTPCYSYYSWDAATLGSGRTIATNNQNAQQSICPKGWKLPSTYNGSGTAAAATDLRALLNGYGGSNIQDYTSSTNPTGATMYSRIGPGSTPNFLLAGSYYDGSFNTGGSTGYYWSSTSASSTGNARRLLFDSTSVSSASNTGRSLGNSVRCLFSEQ